MNCFKRFWLGIIFLSLFITGCSRQSVEINRKAVHIVSKGEIRVVGLTIDTSFARGRQAREIPPFFHDTFESGILETVPDRINNNQLCVFIMKPDSPDFTYFMGVEISKNAQVPEGFKEITLSSAKYASMKIIKRGNADVSAAFKYLLKEWSSTSGYSIAKTPAYIYYDEQFSKIYQNKGYKGNPPATLFVPIVPK